MAKRPTTPSELREAVERTVQSTLDSTGASIARGRRALEDARPATHEDLRELKAELRKIGRRLDAIEEKLPARRGAARPSGKKPASAKAAPKRRASGKAAAPKRRASG
jgi:uncharacterized membrane protein YccC